MSTVLSAVKKCIKFCLKKIISLLPLGNIILFESYPDFTDNTFPVYLALKKRLPGYKLIWCLNGTGEINTKPFLTILKSGGSWFDRIKRFYVMHRCKVFVSCNVVLKKIKQSQISIFLAHGSSIKNVKGVYDMVRDNIDYCNVQSHFFDRAVEFMHNAIAEKRVYFGFPRCDYFFAPSRRQDIDSIVKGKYIIWLPTFRGHKSKTRDDAPGSMFNAIGVPLFYSVEALRDFNDFLQEMNIHILYKPHFAQDMSVVKNESLSNFHIINDKDILSRNLHLYEVLAQSEALITDYSSVFWDYMLLDRPIAITTDDIDIYKKQRGIFDFIEEVYREATEITPDEKSMREFVMNVVKGIDTKQEGRRKWCDITIMHHDGKCAERAADFIIEKLGRS